MRRRPRSPSPTSAPCPASPAAAVRLRHWPSVLGAAAALLSIVLGPVPSAYSAACGSNTPIAYGDTLSGQIAAAAEQDCFDFTGAVGDRIRVAVAETSGTLAAAVDVVRNGTVLCTGLTLPLDCVLDTSGPQTIVVRDVVGTLVGDYNVSLQRLNDPVGCGSLNYGDTVPGQSISLAAQEVCYSFSGTSGDRVRADLAETAGTLTTFQQVVRPDGAVVCSSINVPMDCTLNVTGTHALIIRDFIGSETGTFTVHLQHLDDPVGCGAIDYGDLVLGEGIGQAAEEQCYAFTGSTGTRVRIAAVETTGAPFNAFQELIRPNGTVACSGAGAPLDCTLDASGDHHVIVRDLNGTNTGGYNLFLQQLDTPVGCASLDYGDTAANQSIGNAGEERCYTFTGVAGAPVRVDTIELSGPLNARHEVLRPNGTVLCGSLNTPLDCTLDASGPHTIVVRDAANTGTGSFDLTLQCRSASCITTSPDLTIQKSASVASTQFLRTFTFTLTVANAGSGSASGVVVRDDVQQGLFVRSATSTRGSCTRAGRTVTCSIGTLAPAQTATVTIVALSILKSGTVSNTACVDPNHVVSESNEGNNCSTSTTPFP